MQSIKIWDVTEINWVALDWKVKQDFFGVVTLKLISDWKEVSHVKIKKKSTGTRYEKVQRPWGKTSLGNKRPGGWNLVSEDKRKSQWRTSFKNWSTEFRFCFKSNEILSEDFKQGHNMTSFFFSKDNCGCPVAGADWKEESYQDETNSSGDRHKYTFWMCFRARVYRAYCSGYGEQEREKMMLLYLAWATGWIMVPF